MSARAGEPRSWVIYCEVPDFYVEVERSRDPSLRGRAVVVGGRPDKRGKVQSASAEARARGVDAGMPTAEARTRCPDLKLILTRMPVYRETSGLLRAALRREAEALELDGLGAAYVDGGAHPAEARALAARLLEQVQAELALPLRVGVGPDKLAAREGPVVAEPVFVDRADRTAFMAELPVASLPHVGPKTLAAFERLGIATIGELVACDPAALEEALGRHGARVLDLVTRGAPSRVRAVRHPQTLSREQTLDGSELDSFVLEEQVGRLSTRLAGALRRDGLEARRVALKLHYADEKKETRSRTLRQGIGGAEAIRREALALLARTDAGERPVRKLGLLLAGLASAGERSQQLELFDAGGGSAREPAGGAEPSEDA